MTDNHTDPAARIRQLEARMAQLQHIIDAGTIINSTLDLGTVIERVMTSAKEVMGAEASTVLLKEDETGDLVCLSATGPAGRPLQGALPDQERHSQRRDVGGGQRRPFVNRGRVCRRPLLSRLRPQDRLQDEIHHGPAIARAGQIDRRHRSHQQARPPTVRCCRSMTATDREIFEAFCNQAAVSIEKCPPPPSAPATHHRGA